MTNAKEQEEQQSAELTVLCFHCGRGFNISEEDNFKLPRHNILRGNGSRKSIVCKGSLKKGI